jgi:hypothetical protein
MIAKNPFLTLVTLFSLLGSVFQINLLNTSQHLFNRLESMNSISQKVTFFDLGYTKDETLQGVLVTRNYTVNWPHAWSLTR